MTADWEQRSTRLHTAVEDVGDVPLSCLSGDEAGAYLADLQAVRAKLDSIVCRTLAEPGPAGLRADQTGHRSVAAMVAATTRANPRAVRADQRLGAWLIDYPVISSAVADGRISREHARVIRSRENPRTRPFLPDSQDHLVTAAETCQWAEFLAVLRYWELAADPDGDEPNDQLAARQCSYTKQTDGTVTGRFTFDPLGGHAFLTALEQRVQQLFRHDAETDSLRTATQRRADALVELVSGNASGTDCGGAVPLVHIVMSEQVAADHFERLGGGGTRPGPGSRLALDHDDHDRRCELIDGTPLHPHFALATLATAAFRRMILSPDSERLDLGRAVRGFPAHLKQALLVRSRGRCQHPGCDAPVHWMQADHLIPWSRGGDTSIANGQILCDPHNKLKRDRPPAPKEPLPQQAARPLEDALRRCREIILGADERVQESIKWQTPTFSFNGNIVSFSGNAKKFVSLMFHRGSEIPGDHPILEGDGRLVRNIRFADLDEVEAGQDQLAAVIRAWCDARS